MKTLTWYTTGPNHYPVQYTYEMDGGGTSFGTDYADILKERYSDRKFETVYEWCSGPAFIGFDLLDHGICSKLVCSDVYYPAIEHIRKTAKLINKDVDALLLEDVSLLPDTKKFDLVVGNPPHFAHSIYDMWHRNRIVLDRDWKIHRNFFNNIRPHLNDDAIILLQENLSGSKVETFADMVDESGLKVKDWYTSKNFFDSARSNFIYYIEIVSK